MSHLDSSPHSHTLPVSPSLEPTLEWLQVETPPTGFDRRAIDVCLLAVAVGSIAALAAEVLGALIALFTNLAFFGRFSAASASPADHQLGPWVILVPVLGAVVIGFMARWGSKAIRGHGIPEAMEQVLTNQSRIPPRMTILKPLSAAISIGTGGPFGAEGPIIATGGALGSLLGQLLPTSADERRTLLAAGAAGGMAATFGTPLAAILLAVELLLFEFCARSLVPVALAVIASTTARLAFSHHGAVFGSPVYEAVPWQAVGAYAVVGGVVGLVSVVITRAVYWVEDTFERLPVHWMWWPAIGAVIVGVVGWVEPRTLGVGYTNVEGMITGNMVPGAALALCGLKFLSWVVALGSGTSGGTLAPLLTFGAGLGLALGTGLRAIAPGLGVEPGLAALVGMAAMFGGASRAALASLVFACEVTGQAGALLPVLAGTVLAHLISLRCMRTSIMTEKIERRGLVVVGDYGADPMASVRVGSLASAPVVLLVGSERVADVLERLASDIPEVHHHGFPVVDSEGLLLGVATRRDLGAADPGATLAEILTRPPVVVFADATVQDAASAMAAEGIGRLVVTERAAPQVPVGILTRQDVMRVFASRSHEARRVRSLTLRDLARLPRAG